VPTVMALAGISAAPLRMVEAAMSESRARRIENPSLGCPFRLRASHRVLLQGRRSTCSQNKAGRLRGRLVIVCEQVSLEAVVATAAPRPMAPSAPATTTTPATTAAAPATTTTTATPATTTTTAATRISARRARREEHAGGRHRAHRINRQECTCRQHARKGLPNASFLDRHFSSLLFCFAKAKPFQRSCDAEIRAPAAV
jgi:hypothetical protein